MASFAIGTLLTSVRPAHAEEGSDAERTGALIGASIGFGLGTPITGAGFFVAANPYCERNCSNGRAGARALLFAYGFHLVVVPSIPRMVVGDWVGASLFMASRGVLFGVANAVDPFRSAGVVLVAGVVAPIVLGIVDLATTPQRIVSTKSRRRALGISPAPVLTRGDVTGGMLTVGGVF